MKCRLYEGRVNNESQWIIKIELPKLGRFQLTAGEKPINP